MAVAITRDLDQIARTAWPSKENGRQNQCWDRRKAHRRARSGRRFAGQPCPAAWRDDAGRRTATEAAAGATWARRRAAKRRRHGSRSRIPFAGPGAAAAVAMAMDGENEAR